VEYTIFRRALTIATAGRMQHKRQRRQGPLTVYVRRWQISGVTSWVTTMRSLLLNKGVSVEILVHSESPSSSPPPVHRTLIADRDKHKVGRWRTFISTLAFVQTVRPRHVHMVDGNLAVALALWFRQVPFSYSVHVNPLSLKARIQVSIIGMLCRNVAAITREQSHLLSSKTLVRREWLRIVPNVVMPPSYVRLAPPARLRVGVVSRLSSGKGLERIPKLAQVIAKYEGLSLHLFGDGPLRELLEESVSADIVFHGWVSGADELFTHIDLLAILSSDEVAPTVALEAGIRGIPTACLHPLPGVTEMLGDLAWTPSTDACIPSEEEFVSGCLLHRTWPTPRDLHELVSHQFNGKSAATTFIHMTNLELR